MCEIHAKACTWHRQTRTSNRCNGDLTSPKPEPYTDIRGSAHTLRLERKALHRRCNAGASAGLPRPGRKLRLHPYRAPARSWPRRRRRRQRVGGGGPERRADRTAARRAAQQHGVTGPLRVVSYVGRVFEQSCSVQQNGKNGEIWTQNLPYPLKTDGGEGSGGEGGREWGIRLHLSPWLPPLGSLLPPRVELGMEHPLHYPLAAGASCM